MAMSIIMIRNGNGLGVLHGREKNHFPASFDKNKANISPRHTLITPQSIQ